MKVKCLRCEQYKDLKEFVVISRNKHRRYASNACILCTNDRREEIKVLGYYTLPKSTARTNNDNKVKRQKVFLSKFKRYKEKNLIFNENKKE